MRENTKKSRETPQEAAEKNVGGSFKGKCGKKMERGLGGGVIGPTSRGSLLRVGRKKPE